MERKNHAKAVALLQASSRPRPQGRTAPRGPRRRAERGRQAQGGRAVSRGGLRHAPERPAGLRSRAALQATWGRTSGRSSSSPRSSARRAPADAPRRPGTGSRGGSAAPVRPRPDSSRPPRKPRNPGPSHPTRSRKLRREIEHETRSSLELLFDGHGEDGDVNNRAELPSLRRAAQREARLRHDLPPLGPADALHDAGRRDPRVRAELRAGRPRSNRSERVDYEWELGATRFSNDAWSVTGLVWVERAGQRQVPLHDGRQPFDRRGVHAVGRGLLPVEGPFAGDRVGSVTDNRRRSASRGGCRRSSTSSPRRRWEPASGSNVGTNAFARAGGGPGWNAVARSPDEPGEPAPPGRLVRVLRLRRRPTGLRRAPP